MLLSEAFESYRFEVIVLGNRSSRTEESLLVSKRLFMTYFGDIELSSITHDAVRLWHSRQLQRKISTDTIRGYILHLRVVLRHARMKGFEAIDPASITIPKRSQKVPDFLEPEDVCKLIKAFVPCRGRSMVATVRNRAIVSLLYASGMRCEELCRLKINDLHGRRVTIVGKGDKPRLVFFDERSDRLVREYLKVRDDGSPYLFVSTNTRKPLTRHDIGDVFRWLKIHTPYKTIHAHTLRHSCATNLAQNGMPLHSLQRLLGHANLATTSAYLHVADVRLEEEFERFHTI